MSWGTSLTVMYESPIGNFRIVQKSTTGYYYPQVLEKAVLSDGMVWHYLYIGNEYREDSVISEPLVSLAMRYEQCVNGTIHEYKGVT